MEHQQVVLVVE